MPKGFKVITVREEVYNRIYKLYKETSRKYDNFTSWATEYLLEKVEEDELLRQYAPGLNFISTEGNVVFIKDWFIDRIVEVEIHDQDIGKRFLYCRHCEREDCMHVGFCFAIREVNKILVEKGFKKPRVQ